jgi:hypothetical protein
MLGYRLHIEHIIPTARGGTDDLENLAASCAPCNFARGVTLERHDPASKSIAVLYNPRIHNWEDHFAWGEDGISLIGTTPIGTATILALDINQPLQLSARLGWHQLGLLP